MALSLLSAKIKQMEHRPNYTNSHAYTLRHPGEAHSVDSTEIPRRKDFMNAQNDDLPARQNSNAEEQHEQLHGTADAPLEGSQLYETRPGSDPASLGPYQAGNLDGDLLLTDNATPSSEMNFQGAGSGPFVGSSFDLNMVDLLQGADFNSLFDIVGQQYPSF
jgi:hypothetical protein